MRKRSIAGAMVAITSIVFCFSVANSADFPYSATVVSTNVLARSGPSYGTYPTDRLAKYSQVQVFQDDAKGWVAIRPPTGAFDWVPASTVKRTGNVGEVIASDAPAWIGSNVKKVEKHLSQVKLKPGERLQILGEKASAKPDGTPESWLKVAPPAGEFRWVQAKHLSTEPLAQIKADDAAERLAREERWQRENETAAVASAESRSSGQPTAVRVSTKPRSRNQDDAGTGALTDGKNVVRDGRVEPAQFFGKAARPMLGRRGSRAAPPADDDAPEGLQIEKGDPTSSTATASADHAAETPKSRDIAREGSPGGRLNRISLDPQGLVRSPIAPKASSAATTQSGATLQLPKSSPNSDTQRRPIDATEFDTLLAQINVDLTVMVAQESSQWSLEPLRQRAEALVEDGPTALHRGRARLALDRIVEFESTLPPGHNAPIALPGSQATAVIAPPTKPNFTNSYDAVGYLMPVLSNRQGLPPYQLTDRDGNTLQYVTPAPGMNFSRYVKKQVGLYGQRGYMESLKKQHILAQRIVDLDRHAR